MQYIPLSSGGGGRGGPCWRVIVKGDSFICARAKDYIPSFSLFLFRISIAGGFPLSQRMLRDSRFLQQRHKGIAEALNSPDRGHRWCKSHRGERYVLYYNSLEIDAAQYGEAI